MLVKVLDENRVKILMEDQDIAYYDLPFEKLSDDDPESRAFIYELIRMTYERTGINFDDCRVMIEVIPGVSACYYILLTRIQEKGKEKFQFDKSESAEREMYIFKIDNAQDVAAFFAHLKQYPPEKSDLYYMNNTYYAVLFFEPSIVSGESFGTLLNQLTEFSFRCKYRYINDALLKEWGECICNRNAYEMLNSG